MKKKYLHLIYATLLLIFLPTQILALPKLWTVGHANGTEYTFEADVALKTYKKGDLFEIGVTMTADAFGTTGDNIVAFYAIHIDVEIRGYPYLAYQNLTLPDINTEGGSESCDFALNLTDIEDEYFDVYVLYNFMANNTSGEDNYHSGGFKAANQVKVKEASISIVIPILAVLSVVYIVHKKQKK